MMFRSRSSRRRFLKHAMSTAAASCITPGLLPFRASAAVQDRLPIIDTHQHLWDLSRFRLPWTDSVKQLARNFVMSDYLDATRGLNVVKTVYMEVDVHPSQQVKEAEYVTELCRREDNPMVAAVISGRPNSAGFAAYIRKFSENGYIKGVRQVLHVPQTPSGYCLQEQFVASVRLMGELGMSFDLCMRPSDIRDGARLAALCPDTRFILDHCGNADPQQRDLDPWRRDMAEIAKLENVACKVSGIVASARAGDWKPDDLAPIIHHTVEVFGHDRVMFGGDWPVCTLRATFAQWVEALEVVIRDWPLEQRKKLLHDNALRFYRLS